MTDQADRHEESLGSDETLYDRLAREEERAREEAAARLAADPLPDPQDD
jgi:hypothetical protein